MTGPEKTGLIYTKYTYLYYCISLIFHICYTEPVSVMEFPMECYVHIAIVNCMLIKDKSYFILNS